MHGKRSAGQYPGKLRPGGAACTFPAMNTVWTLPRQSQRAAAAPLAAPLLPVPIHLQANGTRRIVEGDLAPDREIETGSRLLIISRHQSYLTHGLHKYPAKFFPELPRWAVRRYAREGPVIDPMCGSGTVNIEALLIRRPSIGADVDPFARLLAGVKTTPLSAQTLAKIWDWLVAAIWERKHTFQIVLPDFPRRDTLWFRPDISEELGLIRSAIHAIPFWSFRVRRADRQRYRDFFLVAMSSIVRAVSNADNNCTRTVVRARLNKRIIPGMALELFRKAAEQSITRMEEFEAVCPRDVPVEIVNEDARALSRPDESVELAVTSPPYINAVDYPRTHQLEMSWLELWPDGPMANLKRHHIGTEVVRAKEYADLRQTGIVDLDALLADIYEVDRRRSFIIYKYFEDMRRNLEQVRRVLRPGGRYVVVVGNNIIRQRLVPTHQFLAEIAEAVGFELETYFCSEVIRHFIKVPRKERINDDWVLVLRKRP